VVRRREFDFEIEIVEGKCGPHFPSTISISKSNSRRLTTEGAFAAAGVVCSPAFGTGGGGGGCCCATAVPAAAATATLPAAQAAEHLRNARRFIRTSLGGGEQKRAGSGVMQAGV
jgi:hypothetical protein